MTPVGRLQRLHPPPTSSSLLPQVLRHAPRDHVSSRFVILEIASEPLVSCHSTTGRVRHRTALPELASPKSSSVRSQLGAPQPSPLTWTSSHWGFLGFSFRAVRLPQTEKAQHRSRGGDPPPLLQSACPAPCSDLTTVSSFTTSIRPDEDASVPRDKPRLRIMASVGLARPRADNPTPGRRHHRHPPWWDRFDPDLATSQAAWPGTPGFSP